MNKWFVIWSLFLNILSSLYAENENSRQQKIFANSSIHQVNELIRKNQHDEALQLLNEIIEAFPDTPRAYRLRGNIFFVHKRFEESLLDFEKVADFFPNDPNSFVDIAVAQYAMQDHKPALSNINHALAMKPKSPFAFKIKVLIEKDMKTTPSK